MIKTQGTELFLYADGELLTIGCVTEIGELPASRDGQDNTALGQELKSTQHTTMSLGEVPITVNFDSQSYEHNKIRALFLSVASVTAYIGLSETKQQPSLINGAVDLPPNRTWIKFDCRVWSYPLALPNNGVVGLTFSLQIDSLPVISFAGGRQWNGDIDWNGGLLWQ